MSIGSIGGDASQAWQALKESRAKQAASGSAANGTAAFPPLPKDGPSPDGAGVAGTGGAGSASAKVIADLKALFIDLQAGNASGTAGSADAGSAGTASGSAAATSADAGGASAADTSPGVQSDLKTLFGDLSKVGGHGGHRHGHGKPPAAPAAGSTDATAGTATASTALDSASAPPAGSLLDRLAGALKAYAASSLGNSASGNATGSVAAPLSA